jgi:hypothetical protein
MSMIWIKAFVLSSIANGSSLAGGSVRVHSSYLGSTLPLSVMLEFATRVELLNRVCGLRAASTGQAASTFRIREETAMTTPSKADATAARCATRAPRIRS